MSETADRRFDWIAGLTAASGAAVIVPSLVALFVSLVAVAMLLM